MYFNVQIWRRASESKFKSKVNIIESSQVEPNCRLLTIDGSTEVLFQTVRNMAVENMYMVYSMLDAFKMNV